MQATTPTGLIYEAAGSPAIPGDTPGTCRLCGRLDARGVAFRDWLKPTFMDHGLLRPGEIACHACLFCADDRNEALTARTGRDKPQRMRNYTHIVAGGSWYPLGKNQKREMAALLLGDPGPALAVIALSGQKHLCFRARAGWWQIEEQATRPLTEPLRWLLPAVTMLYEAGASKGEIESGHYTQGTLRRLPDLALWFSRESILRPMRGSLAFQLAVWLAQKPDSEETDEDDGPAPGVRNDPSPVVASDRAGLQGEVPHDDLATVRGPNPKRGVHVDAEPVRQPSLFAPPNGDR